jgi:cell wall-associated NlpC family hydrolase
MNAGHRGRHWLASLGVMLGCALVCASALAAPETKPTGPDAIMRLLEEHNLVGANATANPDRSETSLLSHVRDTTSDLVMTAMNFIGVRYRMGGTSAETGFDCSGFTRHIFENSIGLVLPRRAVEQANAPGLLSIGKDELKPGDLVFFNTLRRTFSHVGIYVGDGKFIHAPRAGGQVRVEDMRIAYWNQRFNGARRAPEAPETSTRTSP